MGGDPSVSRHDSPPPAPPCSLQQLAETLYPALNPLATLLCMKSKKARIAFRKKKHFWHIRNKLKEAKKHFNGARLPLPKAGS